MGLQLPSGGHESGWSAADVIAVAPTDASLSCDDRSDIWTPAPTTYENHPVKCVSWAEAYAFCIWDGGFLPSDAEWLYAAAGGSEQRRYPWGSSDPGTSNEYAIYACLYPSGARGRDEGFCNGENLAPVGMATLGAARWGQQDMAGELWEWTMDSTPESRVPTSYAEACDDCAHLSPEQERVVRGGDFESDEDELLPTTRETRRPTGRYPVVGLRCARPL